MITVILTILTLVVTASLILVIRMEAKINKLSADVQMTLDKYILVVRSLGIKEGNKQGKEEQIAIQTKLEEGMEQDPDNQKITGVVTGTIQKIKRV